MYIRFRRLKYRNFLSTGNVPIEIDFLSHHKTLIVGTNGVGKSTMISALSFALFGKDFRGINKPGLVNSVNRRELEVEVEFDVAGKTYKIVRGIKPNVFDVWVDGVKMEAMARVDEQQEWLETTVLRSSLNSLKQIVILGTGFVPFMMLTAQMRRQVIDDVWDLTIFSRLWEALKKRITAVNGDIVNTSTKIATVSAKIDVLKSQIALERVRLNEDKAAKAVEISSLEAAIGEVTVEIDGLAAKVDKAEGKLPDLKGQIADINRLEGERVALIRERGAIADELSFFHDHQTCPKCSQSIGDDIRGEKIADCNGRVATIDDAVNEIDGRLSELKVGKATFDKLIVAIAECRREITVKETRKAEMRKAIEKALADLDGSKRATDIEANEKTVADLSAEFDALEKSRGDLLRKRDVRTAAVPFLKDDGIKAKIIDQYIPVVNGIIGRYLERFNFYVQFELDSEFNETIRSRYRDDFQYNNFSAGERQRIDLAILFAWREIAKMRNSIATNLLILDETLDSSMDAVGIDDLMTILGEQADVRLFVISHRENMADRFDRVLHFDKVGHFTTMKEQ